MQISTVEAIQQEFILSRNSKKLSYDSFEGKSSFDISVREIIHWRNEEVAISQEYILKPQETVYLISEQRISVKPGYVAYVFLKNRLSQKGIMALNTGIIDGGFDGPISTLITNLSKENIIISETDFFRVVFHKIDMKADELQRVKEDTENRAAYSYDDYKSLIIRNFNNLPQHFLDRHELKNQIDKELSQKALNIGRTELGIIFAAITIVFAFLPPLATIITDLMLGSEKVARNEIKVLDKKMIELELKIKNLEEEKKKSNTEKKK